MGGIGKTTLADVIFHRLSSQFEASCFLANVRVKAEEKYGLVHLRNILLQKIFDDENVNIDTPSIGSDLVSKRLGRTKVLIFLDDVNHSSQIELLAGDHHAPLGPGSRIIITTRDRSILKKNVADEKIYKVKELTHDEALQLFHFNAFKNNTPRTEFAELAKKAVDYAAGLPLAVQILGSAFLHCETIEDWQDELTNLKQSLRKTSQALRGSYDGLEETEKEIFLDIACFGKVKSVHIVKRMLDARGFWVGGIRVLRDKCLISISESFLIDMQDLLKEMGRAIVREQCLEEPGYRSRLFTAEDVYHVLKNNTGTATVQAIFFNMSEIEQLHLDHADFKTMHNLRLLNVDSSSLSNYWDLENISLPSSLYYLCWLGYQLKSLPSEFSPENLVELRMPYSNVEKLWNEGQNLGNLKWIDLSSSRLLTEVPDLSESPKLEHINLMGCTSLVQIPSYFQYLDKLTDLNLGDCSKLKSLPEMPGNIECLNLSSTAIKKLPESVWSNEKISSLDIQGCKELKNLPSSICRLKLHKFSLKGCSSLVKFSKLPRNITELELSETATEALPSSIQHFSHLKKIVIENCQNFSGLTKSICKLKSIESLRLTGWFKFHSFPEILEPMENLKFLGLSDTAVKELPSSIENLIGLQTLHLHRCKNLKSLPNSIYKLNCLTSLQFAGCLKLRSFPSYFSVGLCSLEELNLSCCGISELPNFLDCLTSLRDLDLSGTMIQSIPTCIKQASQLSILRLTNCKRLECLPELPMLHVVEARGCMSLKTVSSSRTTQGSDRYEFSQSHLKHLHFSDCLKMDLNARINIMAEAQLSVTVHAMALSKLKEEASYVPCSLPTVVCPGNEIPSWFSNQSKGSSISIKLPSNWYGTDFLGLALSLVVAFDNYNVQGKLAFGCNFNFKASTGESHNFTSPLHWGETKDEECKDYRINSDHVIVWYTDIFDLVGGDKFSTCFFNVVGEASLDFHLMNFRDGSISSPKVKVKKCGIRLLYAREAENVDVPSDQPKAEEDTKSEGVDDEVEASDQYHMFVTLFSRAWNHGANYMVGQLKRKKERIKQSFSKVRKWKCIRIHKVNYYFTQFKSKART